MTLPATARSFGHDPELRTEFPALRAVAACLRLTSQPTESDLAERTGEHLRQAADLLAVGPESAQPSIQAWRATFTALGLRATQYRCAAEALLRRLRTRGDLPRINPVVDLGNAISVGSAIPVAIFDLDRVVGDLTVRHASGEETYTGFDGAVESPPPGEVIFADDVGQAHSRRWCHRQSARSAVTDASTHVLLVAEAMHDRAEDDLETLAANLQRDFADLFGATPLIARLYEHAGRTLLPAPVEL